MKPIICDLCGRSGTIFQYQTNWNGFVCGVCLAIEQANIGEAIPPTILRALGFLHQVPRWRPLRDQVQALISHDRVLRGEP